MYTYGEETSGNLKGGALLLALTVVCKEIKWVWAFG